MKTRKIPERFCLGCRTKHSKRELIRIVKSPTGELSLDVTGKKPGRGAYICPDRSCLEAAKKSKSLERSFGTVIDESIYDQLANELDTRAAP